MLDNTFTCSNGHTFNANAKLRARCPECGVTARRKFDDAKPTVPVEPKVEPVVAKTEPTVKRPVLLKQGRPRVMPKRATTPKKPPVVSKRPTTVIPRKTVTASAGLVRSTKIKSRGTMPTIKARPPKTAPARTIQGGQQPRQPRYWEKVAEKYGI